MEEDNIKKERNNKTVGFKIINNVQLCGLFIFGIVQMIITNVLFGLIFWIIGVILFIFIKGFSDIIDLLDSINKKMDIK